MKGSDECCEHKLDCGVLEVVITGMERCAVHFSLMSVTAIVSVMSLNWGLLCFLTILNAMAL